MYNRIISIFFFLFVLNNSFAQNLEQKPKFSYIENKRQWDNKALFLNRKEDLDSWVLTNGNLLLDFYKIKNKESLDLGVNKDPENQYKNTIKKGHRISFQWLNANVALNFEKSEKQDSYNNYLLGNDTSKHASHVGLYGQVKGLSLYKGIDIKYYQDNGSMRYDLVVHPNANPKQINLKIEGADQLRLSENGNVIISTSLGDIDMQDLYVYELETGKQINCKWVLIENELTLSLGNYDKSNTLIIDPLIYSSYIGGNTDDYAHDVAVDNTGNAYITGSGLSPDFDLTTGAYQTSYEGIWDAFISKFNPSGTSLIFSTFIGGNSAEHSRSIAIDAIGNSYITGYTVSDNFDVTAGAFQTTIGSSGNGDVFVSKLNSSGTALIYSTYLGGSSDDQGFGIALDNLNNAYITGFTVSGDYDITPGAFQTSGIPGAYDAFVTKLNASGSALIYSTYLNGSSEDKGIGIAVDSSNNAYVTGYTFSSDFDITPGVYQPVATIAGEVFVTKVNPTGSGLVYSTFLGGNSLDIGFGIAIDLSGNAYVTGETQSENFDITPGAFQTIEADAGAYSDVFVTKLNSTGSALYYSTYIGGNSNEHAYDIAVDKFGSACITGATYSTNFRTTANSYQTTKDASWDAFIIKLNPAGSFLNYSTFIGGSSVDDAFGIALDTTGSIYITGQTQSSNYDVTFGAFQTAKIGSAYDAFITKIGGCPNVNLNLITSNVSCNGNNDGSISASVNDTSSAYTYLWSNGQTTPMISGLTPLIYTLTATNAYGCALTKRDTIIKPPVVTASIQGVGPICSGQTSQLNASGGNSYLWSTGDTTALINVNPVITTVYSVSISNGYCFDTAYSTITVITTPSANISGNDSICKGQNTILTASGGGTYFWNTGNFSNSITTNSIVDSLYSVIVSNGVCKDTAQFQLHINPLPVAAISGQDSLCNGQNIILTASGGTSYSWSSGATTSNISVNPISNSTYSVIVSNNFGCKDTAQHIVSVIPLPQVSISGPSTICEEDIVTLNAAGIGNLLWSSGETTNQIHVSPSLATNYFVSASNSCGTSSDSIFVNVNSLPVLNTSNDTTILLGNSAQLNADGGISYTWFPTSGLSCISCPDPIATPQNTTIYSVQGTNSNGCSVTRTIRITVDSDFELFVPDVFSPNNDGQNDIVFVRGSGIKELDFVIYDRLGEKIFETNDQNKGWDGTYKGSVLNNGVFVYYLSAKMINDKTIKTKGDITLIK